MMSPVARRPGPWRLFGVILAMLVGNSQGTTNPATATDLPYKWDQPATIARLAINPMALSVPASSKWNTAQELLDDVKKNPKQYKYGTESPARPSVMATAQWLKGAAVNPAEIDRVVAGGGGAMIIELAGAHSEWAVGSVSEVVELVGGGKLRALMVTGGKRTPQLPDVPTPQELGYP